MTCKYLTNKDLKDINYFFDTRPLDIDRITAHRVGYTMRAKGVPMFVITPIIGGYLKNGKQFIIESYRGTFTCRIEENIDFSHVKTDDGTWMKVLFDPFMGTKDYNVAIAVCDYILDHQQNLEDYVSGIRIALIDGLENKTSFSKMLHIIHDIEKPNVDLVR